MRLEEGRVDYRFAEIEHKYGDNIHILNHPYWNSLLAKFSTKELSFQLLMNYVRRFYQHLASEMVAFSFPQQMRTVITRMDSPEKEAKLTVPMIVDDLPIICVDIARAGMIPAQTCFEELCNYFNYHQVRQDHLFLNRKVNDCQQVVGVDDSGNKIGGGQEAATVIIPDPMGATGGSIVYAIDYYKKRVKGKAKKYIALHLIITPEYIKRLQLAHSEVEVFALRLDRGMSSLKIQKSIPGSSEEEFGLNNKQYIIPGAGGVGELLNNSIN